MIIVRKIGHIMVAICIFMLCSTRYTMTKYILCERHHERNSAGNWFVIDMIRTVPCRKTLENKGTVFFPIHNQAIRHTIFLLIHKLNQLFLH